MGEPAKITLDDLCRYIFDPLLFVKEVYPWGEGQLAGSDGPSPWQEKFLQEIGDESREPPHGFRKDIFSEEGIGKTTALIWATHWFLSTRPEPHVDVSANTPEQLDETWQELSRWHRMSFHSDFFVCTDTKLHHKDSPWLWYATKVPWHKDRCEAFASSASDHILFAFDEADEIDDIIYEVVEAQQPWSKAILLTSTTKKEAPDGEEGRE